MKRKQWMMICALGQVALALGGCGTNFNDVQITSIETNGEILVARENRLGIEAQERTKQMQILATAPTGGTTIRDPESGFETTVTNANPALYSGMGAQAFRPIQGDDTGAPVTLRPPQSRPGVFDKALAFVGNFVEATAPSFLQAWGIQEQGRTQRFVAEQNTRALLGQAEYDYLTDQSMFGALENANDNMGLVATTATGDMRQLGQSYGSEMRQLGETGYQTIGATSNQWAQAIANMWDNSTKRYKNDTTIIRTEESSVNTSSSSSQWTEPDWDAITDLLAPSP